ncbi:bifunctional diguanylate cyclase/phosphodiesterase [Dyella lutea]|uniref:EAL domain-containing protein n=1 Tax=Dyella lutea TaxID=2950441 RepID=A0ABT1F6W6_9GAMM|nr:EAL domain-containing protein [Dyella lutea]MCP1373090.1 EAL domain-containing protein [Dyella lutea]
MSSAPVPRPDPDLSPQTPVVRPPWGGLAWVWVLATLLAGVLLTLVLHQQQQVRQRAAARAALDELADKSFTALQVRLVTSELLIRSVQTLYIASDQVTADDFQHFYANLRPRSLFPSLVALAYAQREAGPSGARYITRHVAPLEGNERLLGLDVTSQTPNMSALVAAQESGQPVLSAPFDLVQHEPDGRPIHGVTMRLPVYSEGPPPATSAERLARLEGSIAASFRVSQLIGGAFTPEALHKMHVQVFDLARPGQALFDSDAAAVAGSEGDFRRDLHYGGRVWRVRMDYPLLPERWSWSGTLLPAGLLISLLLALLVWSVAGTQRRAMELGWRMSRRYRESEERFRALNELLPALVLLADANEGRVTYANRAARDRLGDPLGQALPTLFEDAAVRGRLADPQAGAVEQLEAVLRHGQRQRFWASVSIAHVELDGVSKLLMVASDITEQRLLNDRLLHQASHDALTELYNRREFERHLGEAMAAIAAGAPAAALLYIDLDQFKLINDTSGHMAGDQLLAQLAMTMHEQLGDHDVLARLGGDEFGVLLPRIGSLAAAEAQAERLRRRIDGYVFMWEQRSYSVSASVGGVMLDKPGMHLHELFAQADTACYMAKEAGRNRVHFYSEHDDETARRRSEMEWANRLRWAADEGRLLLYYQELLPLAPQPGEGVRIELLLRFRDEEGRLVVPGAFIPAAERYGLMPTIDRWVIETALAHFDQLHPAGASLQLATINLSGASVEDDALADRIIELLGQHRVDPSRVCFEVTETVAVRHLSQVARFMQRLRAVGCKVALDDFGAGMSSFGYLKNLPVDIIKIDGSFIRDMLDDPVSHAMVRAATDIGHRIGLLVVAEWVTSDAVMQALRELGVDLAQGFSLHRPEPVPFQRD